MSTGVCSGRVMSLAALLQFNGLRKVCWGVTMPLELLGHGLNNKSSVNYGPQPLAISPGKRVGNDLLQRSTIPEVPGGSPPKENDYVTL